jgi:hypothetical protein
MVETVQSATSVLVIAGGLTCIGAVTALSIVKVSKKSAGLAVLLTALASCVLMIPVISSFNYLVKAKVEGTVIDEAKAEIRAQKAEAQRLITENKLKQLEREKLQTEIAAAKQTIEIEALNDTVKLLENARLSMQSFQKILELALLQTNLKQTLVKKEPLSKLESGLGLRADYYYDEILVVITHDITAKFGVNLNQIKISRIDGNTALISGIHPVFIGTSKNITGFPVKEKRRVNYKKKAVDSVIVQNDNASVRLADTYAQTYETEFQTKLSKGTELDFMDAAVVQLAENFLRVMFAPLYKNIRFDKAERPDSLPIMEYLQKELTGTNQRKAELVEIYRDLTAVQEQLNAQITAGAEDP